ncbi:Uncharacterised protein [BD1-7 clade bacterium]|uniref:Uncharacterized protein n=1 Tax=BD1-7 clade bacterium TaxID=2029982 RepID=A0A5S9NPW3_9GAMM|nr:Uncharacterised protein [BD1-7 clade bacterium]
MDITKLAEKVMAMDDESWARHANPWSVYTRFSIMPLMSLAFWSREWIGYYSLIFIGLTFAWIWINPRLFSAPKITNNWASMGTFGERIYLNRKDAPIPAHHVTPTILLQVLSGVGFPIFVYGLYSLNIWILLLGNLWVMVFKAWFVDRMVWLFLDVKDTDERYLSWIKD